MFKLLYTESTNQITVQLNSNYESFIYVSFISDLWVKDIVNYYNQFIKLLIIMFDFLNKATHHHPAKSIQIPLDNSFQFIQENIKTPNKQQTFIQNKIVSPHKNKQQVKKIKPQKTSIVAKLQKGNEAALDPKLKLIFNQILVDSKKVIAFPLLEDMILKTQKEREQKVYVRQMSSSQEQYLNQILDKTRIQNSLVKKGLNDVIHGAIQQICFDIESNKEGYNIYKKRLMNKQDLAQLQKMDQFKIFKIQDGQLSQKIGDLRMELNFIDQNINEKAKEIVLKKSYGQDHQKTKKAEQLIKQKQIQREQIKRKKNQSQKKRKIKQIQQKSVIQSQKQKAKSQRHEKIVHKIQQKKVQKIKRQQQIQKERKRFALFLKQYKNSKPLFQLKQQEQFKKQVIQRKQKFQKLLKKKSKFTPLNFQQLQDFQQKYLQLKRQLYEKKQMQMSIAKQQQQLRLKQMKDKNFKGKYRYLILQEMVKKKQLEEEKLMKKQLLQNKKRAYSVDVKQKFKPTIDLAKKLQSQRIFSTVNSNKKIKGPIRVNLNSSQYSNMNSQFNTISHSNYSQQQSIETNPQKQGDRNFRIFKQYIHQKIQKGQIKKKQDTQNSSKYQTFTPKFDYLKQIRQKRQKQSTVQQTDQMQQKVIKGSDVATLKIKAEQLDQKTKRKQLKLKRKATIEGLSNKHKGKTLVVKQLQVNNSSKNKYILSQSSKV